MKLSLWKRYVPGVTGNPVKLIWKLLTEKNPAARSALYLAVMGILLAPLDFIFKHLERSIYEKAPDPTRPIILICGPPRSGTTLVAQYLINTLEVSYINNLSSLFPRSPILANSLFGRVARYRPGNYHAFYGRSRGLSGLNDGLYIWDRWLGSDRSSTPTELNAGAEVTMPQFFGALQHQSNLPVINKVNRLVTCADLISPVLKKAIFICLKRDPVMLAQSLLIARTKISGNEAKPYGVTHDTFLPDDPIEDVCRQVEFYEMQIKRLENKLGKDKFVVLQYEEFCQNPEALASKLAQVFNGELITRLNTHTTEIFNVSSEVRIPISQYQTLEKRLAKKPS